MAEEKYLGQKMTPEQEAQLRLDQVFQNPALDHLAGSFGFEGAAAGTTAGRIRAFKTFANINWDFRGGKERWEAEPFEPTPEQTDEIFAVARRFGPYNMVDSTEPVHSSYDFVTILGAGNDGPLFRVRYAKEQIEKLTGKPGYILLLGSARPVTPAERNKTDKFAPGAVTEFDLMNSAVEEEYGVSTSDEQTFELYNFSSTVMSESDREYWKIRHYETAGGMQILSVCAPQVEGERRVNTADTYRFMREVMGREVLDGKRVLNVTHAVYTPFQDMDAHRMLGIMTGATIDTIGFAAGYSGIVRKPDALLQEMNSAANSAGLLQKALSGVDAKV